MDIIPFFVPDIGEDEINEVVETLKSGWLTTGAKVHRLEADFAQFLDVKPKNVIAINSATSGLSMALTTLGIGQGDEVILPDFTYTASAEAIMSIKAKPVVCDVQPGTLNMSWENIEPLITKKTKAIMPVHFAGHSCEMDSIIELSKIYGLKIVEDAAHALPSRYNGRLIGSLNTDATVYSFYANKNITTGEGGMVVMGDTENALKCKRTSLHGIRENPDNQNWDYEVVSTGFKCNMPDIAAAIGIHQLKKLNSFHAARSRIATRYLEEFKGTNVTPLQHPICLDDHAWHLFVIRTGKNRNDIIAQMAEKGIFCSVHFKPLSFHKFWRDKLNLSPMNFPVSKSASEQVISLPIYPSLSEDKLYKIIESLLRLSS